MILAGIITSPSVMKAFAGLWEIYAVFCDGSSSADIFPQLSIFRRRLGKRQFNNRRLIFYSKDLLLTGKAKHVQVTNVIIFIFFMQQNV